MEHQTYPLHAYRLHMVKEKKIRFLGNNQISTSSAGSKLIKAVIGAIGQTDRENFVAVMLNTKNIPVGANLVAIGSLNRCMVQPREIIKAAISLPCRSLILGHNHPSGDPSPSPEDSQITKRIMIAAEFFDIEVLDHIIVDMDSDKHYSYSEQDTFKMMKEQVKNLIPK
jgi:DNA repair protein RadC